MATTYTVSNQSELMSVMGKVSGGDTILLESGSYGSVDFNGLAFNDYVTITSADGANGAVFTDIGVYDSSYLRIDGVHVSNPSNGSSASKIVTIEDGSHHVEFINSEVHGKIDGDYTGHYGIYSNSTDNIIISNNDIHDVLQGVVVFSSTNLEVSENVVDYIGEDGFKFGGIDGFLIENNTHLGHVFRTDGAHLDFIQFQGTSGSSNGVLRGNVLLPSNVANIQGIFLKGSVFTNILIEENIIYTGMANGIKVSDGSGITVRYNTVLNAPDTVHNATYIITPSGSTVEHNIISSTSGGVSGTNIMVQHDDPGDVYYYDDLFVNAKEGLGITLEDLAPVIGSIAETEGASARLQELLDGGWEPVQREPDSSPEPTPPPEPETETDPVVVQPETGPVDLGAVSALLNMAGIHNFSSSGDVIELAPSDDLRVDAATICFTFNADTVSGMRGLVSRDASGYAGGGNHFTSYIKDGMLYVRLQDGSGDTVFQVGGINAGQSYDIQISFGDGEARLYVNGELTGSQATTTSWVSNGEWLQIGANGWASDSGETGHTGTFDGTISNVMIFDEALEPDEVAVLEELLNGGPLPEPTTELETTPEPEPETDPVEQETADVLLNMAGDYSFASSGDVIELAPSDDLEVVAYNLFKGGAGKDKLRGGDGEDNLKGGGGKDKLYGGDGEDILEGGAGKDKLRGENGDDLLIGDEGKDKLFGGAGSDIFKFDNKSGKDKIIGFDALDDSEVIDLHLVSKIKDFSDLSDHHMKQVGDKVIINDGSGNKIKLLDVDIHDLDANDFIF